MNNNCPMYKQIYTEIREQILSGALSANDRLPSIRQLAKELGVSVITIKRAYKELEDEGYIYTMESVGCFVACIDNESFIKERLINLDVYLRDVIKYAMNLKLDKTDIITRINMLWEED